jgi:acetylornithine deacetylase/succinyl-diaminopimelate desuccinylase-like protein
MSDFRIDRERLVDELADLVRIDSTNPGLVPDGAGEAAVADYICESGVESEKQHRSSKTTEGMNKEALV